MNAVVPSHRSTQLVSWRRSHWSFCMNRLPHQHLQISEEKKRQMVGGVRWSGAIGRAVAIMRQDEAVASSWFLPFFIAVCNKKVNFHTYPRLTFLKKNATENAYKSISEPLGFTFSEGACPPNLENRLLMFWGLATALIGTLGIG